MAARTFFAAKVNINGNIFSSNVEELIKVHIPSAILAAKPQKLNSFTWSFTDVREVVAGDVKVIVGNVTKSKYATQTYRIGSATTKLTTEHELATTAFFVYKPDVEIMIHEVTAQITEEAFRSLFEKLLSTDIHIGQVVVNPIPEPLLIRKEMELIDHITDIHFRLFTPNPSAKEFNHYNRIIEESQAKQIDVKYSNPDGLRIIGNEPAQLNQTVDDGIELVEAGYGFVEVKGFNQSFHQGKRGLTREIKKKKFSSRNTTRKIKSHEHDETSLIWRIIKFIMDVKSKVQSDGDERER